MKYNPKKFFESWYSVNKEFSDASTIAPNHDPLFTLYHYNTVENSIIEFFSTREINHPAVLDIGSGSGHWIDFYLNIFGACHVSGIEISGLAVRELKSKFKSKSHVDIKNVDISETEINFGRKFDIINAIGVIFHIVDDKLWKRSIKNLSLHLEKEGVIIIGGQFGRITQDVQFHNKDDFSNWEEVYDLSSDVILVNKRIRSLHYWKRCVKEANLHIVDIYRSKSHPIIRTPENNVMFLSHK